MVSKKGVKAMSNTKCSWVKQPAGVQGQVFVETVGQIMNNLDACVMAVYWDKMEAMLTADSPASERINAILGLGDAMEKAVKTAQKTMDEYESANSRSL
jgi:hypothetical protein